VDRLKVIVIGLIGTENKIQIGQMPL